MTNSRDVERLDVSTSDVRGGGRSIPARQEYTLERMNRERNVHCWRRR